MRYDFRKRLRFSVKAEIGTDGKRGARGVRTRIDIDFVVRTVLQRIVTGL